MRCAGYVQMHPEYQINTKQAWEDRKQTNTKKKENEYSSLKTTFILPLKKQLKKQDDERENRS